MQTLLEEIWLIHSHAARSLVSPAEHRAGRSSITWTWHVQWWWHIIMFTNKRYLICRESQQFCPSAFPSLTTHPGTGLRVDNTTMEWFHNRDLFKDLCHLRVCWDLHLKIWEFLDKWIWMIQCPRIQRYNYIASTSPIWAKEFGRNPPIFSKA